MARDPSGFSKDGVAEELGSRDDGGAVTWEVPSGTCKCGDVDEE